MTSVRPNDYPSPKKHRQCSKDKCSPESSPKSRRQDEDDVFCGTDCHSDTSAFCDNLTCSPEEERFPVYGDHGDAESQPLLGVGNRGPSISINVAAGCFLAIFVSAVVVFHLLQGSRGGYGG